MSNQDKDSKLVVGAVIGAIVGVGAFTIFLAMKRKEAPLGAIGEAITHFGEIFGNHGIEEPEMVKQFEKKIHKNGSTADEVLDWVATGIYLWKKFKN
jgi:hypothetical protein